MPHVRPRDDRCPDCDRLALRVSELMAAVELLWLASELGEAHPAVVLARAAVERAKADR